MGALFYLVTQPFVSLFSGDALGFLYGISFLLFVVVVLASLYWLCKKIRYIHRTQKHTTLGLVQGKAHRRCESHPRPVNVVKNGRPVHGWEPFRHWNPYYAVVELVDEHDRIMVPVSKKDYRALHPGDSLDVIYRHDPDTDTRVYLKGRLRRSTA